MLALGLGMGKVNSRSEVGDCEASIPVCAPDVHILTAKVKQVGLAVSIEIASMPGTAPESIARPGTEGVYREPPIAVGEPHVCVATAPNMDEICRPVPVEIPRKPHA